jgi:ElaB/YqjD/DUF883 family membrane-anchored ribosome-binding protein
MHPSRDLFKSRFAPRLGKGIPKDFGTSAIRLSVDRRRDGTRPAAINGMTESTYGKLSEETRDAAARLADTASRTVDRASEMASHAQTRVADYFREHDVQDMVDDLGSYVKKHPVQSLLAAASIGFLAAALLRRR